MDFLLAFGLFLGAVALCMVLGQSLSWALLLGFGCFFLVGLHRGFSARRLAEMSLRGGLTSLNVQRTMLLIGLLTGLWRASGTIGFFVHTGLLFITPRSFILVAFLLPAILCLAFGSSFGVAGTAGVILMSIARSGGASLPITAGAVLSGAYVGERLSPASSAAALTASIAGVDQRVFQRRMWQTSALPLGLSVLLYALLAVLFPSKSADIEVLQALEAEFSMAWPTVIPAVALVALPWFHVSAFNAIAVSCVLAGGVALTVQGLSPAELVHSGVFGYTAHQPELVDILSGGGVLSMISVVVIVFLSCGYSGLFDGTGILDSYKESIGRLADRIGLFPTHILLSIVCAGLFCNQVISIVMPAEILKPRYAQRGLSAEELGTNLGNSAIDLPGLVPWCIACSVPLATIGSGPQAIPFAFFLYLVPLSYLLTGHRKGVSRKWTTKSC